ncbi:MAG: TatD family hydrolase [Trichlorobacter sp.]|uniref:TatD family hydrolase n=1 Tax=Trichlorobacter sp. TaxID=2911007 RepID=UPI00256B249B|nr:TatD family hydrolase [Trichlorobacter sp.]MDK9717435.1 TatD family hydrolase [Trichlorobacter sp.]
MLVDTHCHLDLPPLVEQLDELLAEARAAGVTKWIVPSVHPDGWQRISELAIQHPALRPAYGIHPLYAATATAEQLQQLRVLTPTGVAIGEIGLDATYGNLDKQEALFREQLRIARYHQLPVLIHCRRAIGRTLAILREERADQIGGIMHAFSGSLESALECIKLGFVISLSATLTRSNAVRPVLLAGQLPLNQLVLETDAPDLPPAGHQGCFNRPSWLLATAHKLSAIKGMTLTEITKQTTATAQRVIPKL